MRQPSVTWGANTSTRRAPAGSESGLVSDFDDGSTATRFRAGWSISTDAMAGGASSAEMAVVDGGATNCSNHLKPRSGRRDGEGGERGDGEDDKATM